MSDFAYRPSAPTPNERWLSSRRCGQTLKKPTWLERNGPQADSETLQSPIYNNPFYSARFETGSTPCLPQR